MVLYLLQSISWVETRSEITSVVTQRYNCRLPHKTMAIKLLLKCFQNIFYPSVSYICIQEVQNILETIFSFPQQEEDYTTASICIWPGLELGECRQVGMPPAKFVNIFISHLLTSKKHQASVSHVKFQNCVLRYKNELSSTSREDMLTDAYIGYSNVHILVK